MNVSECENGSHKLNPHHSWGVLAPSLRLVLKRSKLQLQLVNSFDVGGGAAGDVFYSLQRMHPLLLQMHAPEALEFLRYFPCHPVTLLSHVEMAVLAEKMVSESADSAFRNSKKQNWIGRRLWEESRVRRPDGTYAWTAWYVSIARRT